MIVEAAPPPAPDRRVPRQERSRAKVRAVEEAARRLIGEQGSDAVSMRDIAAEAGVPVSSIYQYFPDKTAILRQLMIGYFELFQSRLARVLDRVETPDDVPQAIDRMVDVLVRVFREEKEFPTIWAAALANPELREHDLEDTLRISEYLAARLEAVMCEVDRRGLRDLCFYAAQTAANTVRVASYSPTRERNRLLRELKTLLKLRIESLRPER